MPSAPLPDPFPWRHRLDPRHSLPALVTLVVAGSALGLVLAFSYVSGAMLRRQLERRVSASFETLAEQVGDKIERTIYERYRQLQFAASLPAFRNAGASLAERRAVVEALHDTSADYAWTGFADAEGSIVAASSGLFEKDNVAAAPWFVGARRRPFVGPVRELSALAAVTSMGGNETPRFFEVAVPLNSASGQFLGVLCAHVRWTWAREVQLSVVPETARREQLGVTVYNASGDILLDSGGSGLTEPLDVPPELGSRPANRGTFLERTGHGIDYLTSYVRLRGFREYRGLGWLVAMRQPAVQVFAPVQELRRTILNLGLSFVFMLAVTTWFVAARLERRFRAVALAASRIGDGDILSLMPRPRRDSEFARMCAALTAMVEKFRHREETLETANARLATQARQPTRES
jgi:HAMP domain-containing protein